MKIKKIYNKKVSFNQKFLFSLLIISMIILIPMFLYIVYKFSIKYSIENLRNFLLIYMIIASFLLLILFILLIIFQIRRIKNTKLEIKKNEIVILIGNKVINRVLLSDIVGIITNYDRKKFLKSIQIYTKKQDLNIFDYKEMDNIVDTIKEFSESNISVIQSNKSMVILFSVVTIAIILILGFVIVLFGIINQFILFLIFCIIFLVILMVLPVIYRNMILKRFKS